MRIVVSSALAVVQNDLAEMRKSEEAIISTITALEAGLDTGMLMSKAYVSTAELISTVLIPTAYSICNAIKDRTEADQSYADALGTLSDMDIWDEEEINKQYRNATEMYKTLCDLMNNAAGTPEAALLSSACEQAEAEMNLWDSKLVNFTRFLQSTNNLYNISTSFLTPLHNACRNTCFAFDSEKGCWLIDNSLTVEGYLALNGSTVDKDVVVFTFERLHPNDKDCMNNLYKKADEGIFTYEKWLEVRYCLYTAPKRIRTLYFANIKDIKSIAFNDRSTHYMDSEIYIHSGEKTSQEFADALFHEMGHSIDDSASGQYRDFATFENKLAPSAGLQDTKDLFYKIAVETLHKRRQAAPDKWLNLPDFVNDWTDSLTAHLYTNVILDARKSSERLAKAQKFIQNDPCLAEAVETFTRTYRENGTISDVSGGVSGNLLTDKYCHPLSYWKGINRYTVNTEGFAGYLSDFLTKKYSLVTEVNTDFKNSANLYEQVIQEALHDAGF